ncbi:MAG: hypothetical protein ACOCYB_04815 [Alkalispirochaeta sp.]
MGNRITQEFVTHYLGRVCDSLGLVWSEEMLKPEHQNLDDHGDGINNIVDTQRTAEQLCLDDRRAPWYRDLLVGTIGRDVFGPVRI